MREVVLDTETTGFDPETGDRIVEIGALELLNHMPTGRTFHVYLNPERAMPEAAFGVHGIGCDLLTPPRAPKPGEVTLRDKPLFHDVARKFLDFVEGSKLVIHNAAFDMKFLNAELRRLSQPPLEWARAVDTLDIAKQKYPGSPASLDALCRRFGINNSQRLLHGALLDSEILAEVYLELIGGRQPDFGLSAFTTATAKTTGGAWRPGPRPVPLPQRVTADELAAHQTFVAQMGDAAVWNKYRD